MDGLQKFPGDPFLMSYYGYLLAHVDNDPREGINMCRDAISYLDRSMPVGGEFYYPVFYLNLGRAYLKEDRQSAIKSFRTGLQNDPENREIMRELSKLGTRRKPALPFLRRNNPINKYVGMFLHRALL
jgi:hypothetical protein